MSARKAMAGRVRGPATWPFGASVDADAGGLDQSRSTVNLTVRILGRAYEASPGGARPGFGSSRSPAAAFAVADAALAVWLARTDRPWPVPRLVLDALDQAWWSRRFVTADRAVIAGAPLAAEAGIALGAVGLVVPAVNFGAIWSARRRAGLRTSPFAMTAQVAAVALGASLAWFARRHDRDIVGRAQSDAEAERTAGYVAGQNSVAAGADSVIDLLARTEPLLAVLEHDTALPQGRPATGSALHAWKAQLAGVTAERAAYLGTVLRSWERARQSADLRADVSLLHDAAVGTTVITEGQAESLRGMLDHLGPVGELALTIVDPDHVLRPGRAFSVRVGDHVITVPDDPAVAPPAFDPVPLMVAAGSLSVATTAVPAYGGTAAWMVVAGTSVGLALASWVRRRRVAGRPVPEEHLIDVLLGLHAVVAAGIVATRRHATEPGGRHLLPQADGYLVSAMLVTGFVSRRIGLPGGVALVAKVLASVTPSLHLAGALHQRHVRFGALVPAAAFLGTRGMFRNVELHRDELIEEWRQAAAIAREGSYHAGRRSVIDLVYEAWIDADRRITAVRSAGVLPDLRLLEEAGHRLVEAEHQLSALVDDAVGGPSSAVDRAKQNGRSSGHRR